MRKISEFIDVVLNFKDMRAWLFWGIIFGISILIDLAYYGRL